MLSLRLPSGPGLGFTKDMSTHFFGWPGRYFPLLLTQFLLCMALALGVACSSGSESNGTDSADTESSTSKDSPICNELDAVRRAVEEVQIAVRAGDVSGTQVAIANGRDYMDDLRQGIDQAKLSDEASQGLADLSGALAGMQTTARQVQTRQGGEEQLLLGVAQQLEIQLPALASAMNSLRSQTASARCGT